jgi:hypothetical protein
VGFGIRMSANAAMEQQARAWTSPFWYTPGVDDRRFAA